MHGIQIIAKEIVSLMPKLLRGLRAGFIGAPNVTTSQVVILIRIFEKKTTRIGALSKEMRVSAPTITGVIDRLVRNGYLSRIHDKEDRRAVNVELTSKGKNLVEQMLSEIHKRWYRILAHLTVEERDSYLRVLKRIVEVLAEENV